MAYEFTTGTSPLENVIQQQGVGPLPADVRALPFNANWRTSAHEVWIVSDNPLIYPGQWTISGTWAAGDEAIAAVRWGNTSLGFSHIVQAGQGPQQIAEALRNQMLNNATFAQVKMGVMPVGEYPSPGHFSWHICPHYALWNTEPRINLTSGKTSANGVIQVALQPVNLLDTPACTLTLGRAVPGRPAQAMDLIAEHRVMGQTDLITSPDDVNLRQIYINIQYYVKSAKNGAPMGMVQYQVASANANNVVNAMQLADGLVLCDAQGRHPNGGAAGDGMMGSGNINIPAGCHIYRDGVQIL